MHHLRRLLPYLARHRVPFWGGIAGLRGRGSGALKVLALDQAMRLPFKVSTTTSNFM